MSKYSVFSILVCAALSNTVFAVELQTVRTLDGYGVQVRLNDAVTLQNPAQGLWSIGIGFNDGWPNQWYHANAKTVTTNGKWTILTGQVELPQGKLLVRDAYRDRKDYIECVRRFQWTGGKPLEKCTLSVRFQTNTNDAKVFLPGIMYYGNPSGAKSGRVALFNRDSADKAIFEEHRYTMPFASVEWSAAQNYYGAAMHTTPSKAAYANLDDQWWSLGVAAIGDMTELLALSGPVAGNGKNGVVKAVQAGFMPYGQAFLNILPNGIIEKRLQLQLYSVKQKGSGFSKPLNTSLSIFQPYSCNGMPSFDDIISSKSHFAQSRWFENDVAAGFGMYPSGPPKFVMGWCGQAAACGYAMQVLGDRSGIENIDHKIQASLDHLSTSPFNDNGFMLIYDTAAKKWSGQDPVSQGQGMDNFANAVLAARKSKKFDTRQWERFLKKACDVHSARILKDDWHPRSTAEGFFISPLCKAYELFHTAQYKKAALKAADHYGKRHISMDEPYWGGTLDASCEDKEGAWAAFQGFLAVYEMTTDKKYLQWATHACDVVLSYVVIWDVDLPPGRLNDHGFKTTGWTMVSPQNQHVDVYGVLCAPSVYRMGQILKRDELKKLSLVMFRSCGQLLDPFGSQGEQIQHTNFAQHGDMSDVYKLRGGYSEGWTVFWITAHFLNAAAQFDQLGVDM